MERSGTTDLSSSGAASPFTGKPILHTFHPISELVEVFGGGALCEVAVGVG